MRFVRRPFVCIRTGGVFFYRGSRSVRIVAP